jgi:protein-disulfide isomerase
MESTRTLTVMPKTQSDASLHVVDGDHLRGPRDAPVTILVYGDYECPYTRALELALAELRGPDGGTFRSVYRYFPLREIHPHAQNAAEAAEAVYALGGAAAFWRMHDGLFAHQQQLDPVGLERLSATAGVDPIAWHASLADYRFAERVERDVRTGRANGVSGTPSIFIDGESYVGARDAQSLRGVLAMPLKAEVGR